MRISTLRNFDSSPLSPNSNRVTLTFTVAGSGSTTDALGNTVIGSATVTLEAIVAFINLSNLTDIQQALGVTDGGYPVKIRPLAAVPSSLTLDRVLTATTTIQGRSCSISMKLGGTYSSRGILNYVD